MIIHPTLKVIAQLPHHSAVQQKILYLAPFHRTPKMRLTLFAFPLFASLAVAMPPVMPPVTPPPSLDWLDAKIPDCGRGCLNDGLKAVGCDVKDYKCRCDNGHELFKIARPCIESNCTNEKEDRLNAASTTICTELAWGDSSWYNKTFHLLPSLADP
ncbi:hypothetical protein RRF57_005564 [Xylaria bambusicola]|uniref:CFEM domain-containing protein n=1 Tax=Xylaria bambusicola TaxID=326684 RepID=A0AAN7UQH1_9PEZI